MASVLYAYNKYLIILYDADQELKLGGVFGAEVFKNIENLLVSIDCLDGEFCNNDK